MSGSGPGMTVIGLRFCIKLIYVSTFGDPGLSRRDDVDKVTVSIQYVTPDPDQESPCSFVGYHVIKGMTVAACIFLRSFRL